MDKKIDWLLCAIALFLGFGGFIITTFVKNKMADIALCSSFCISCGIIGLILCWREKRRQIKEIE